MTYRAATKAEIETITKSAPWNCSMFIWLQTAVEKHGYARGQLTGRIGGGAKSHRFSTVHKADGDTTTILDAQSYCGSMKFSPLGFSKLSIYGENGDVTCAKCK